MKMKKYNSDLYSFEKSSDFGIALISLSELHSFSNRISTHPENHRNCLQQLNTRNY
ncbi:hypothetical protein HMPREF0204_12942 [Chryseobacterium gleum ATCC 35910]|uniref:Uncharacterized protein n=1 Tax=Chryseobacterium gleum ATCC 35910 TaxID=525257 RepID=A0ABN0ALM3_CHRGE|nr:hypothetical protein HMPREF0204_12942 [Chryseobacterium gleum ATCC 35910]